MCVCLYHMNKFEKKETKQRTQKSLTENLLQQNRGYSVGPFLAFICYILIEELRTERQTS